jgi:hypothetical protein
MTTKKVAYLSYYSLIACILAVQVGYTIFQTSLVVGHGRKLEELQERKDQLAQEQQLLQTSIAERLSLTQLTEEELKNYQNIASPIMVETTTSLAAIQ